MTEPRSGGRGLRLLLAVFVLTSLAAGALKLQVQRAHPPHYATQPWNNYDGWVAIDAHALRAGMIRDWMSGADPGAERLLRSLRRHHSAAIAVPPLVALASVPLRSIPLAFAVLSGLAWLAQLALVLSLAARIGPRGDPDTGLVAGILFAAHCLSARTALQLFVDPFVALCTVLALVLSIRWVDSRPGAGRALAAALAAALVVGVFTKLSFLPVLALPACVALHAGARSRLVAALALGALPAALLGAFLILVVGPTSSVDDMRHFSTSWSLAPERLREFALEMALLVQLAPLLFLMRPKRRGDPGSDGRAGPVWIAILLVLVPLLAFGLPAVPRLYLPVLGPAAVLCGARLVRVVGPRWRLPLLAAYGIGNLAVAGYGLYLQSG